MKDRSELRYHYRFLCAVILVLIATGMFYYVWIRFVTVNNMTKRLTGYGNQGMAILIYMSLYSLTAFFLRGFKIGVERTANVIASQILALLFTDAVEVLISMAITGQFRFFGAFAGRYLVLFVFQSAVIGLAMIPLINFYRKFFPPWKVVEIYGDHRNNLFRKVNSLKYKYQIQKQVYYKDANIRRLITQYDAILINDVPAHPRNYILKVCFERNKRVYFVPKISDILVKQSDELNLFDTPLFLNRNRGMSAPEEAVKRGVDIFLSVFALILFSPIFLITSLAIRLEDGGPVFFRQERCTVGGRKFMILKFRSMVVDAEKDGRSHPAGEQDDRITRVGRIIRAYRIDELPQLINILKGEMSIVGPRPERVEHMEYYKHLIPEFSLRNKVKGGLTGYAQVYGKYNTSALDKLKLDLVYITNYSLLLDLSIIIETIKILFQKESTEGFSEESAAEIHDYRAEENDTRENDTREDDTREDDTRENDTRARGNREEPTHRETGNDR